MVRWTLMFALFACCPAATFSLRLAAQEAGGASAAPTVGPEDEEYRLMKLFVDSMDQIEKNYVTKIDRRILFEAALNGMMEKLDPYSNYIGPEDISRFNAQVEQEFGGIGIQLAREDESNRLMVMTPLPGTPAYRAGVLAGDHIVEIEGKATTGLKQLEAVNLLKGAPGSSVTITVVHEGNPEPQKIALVREIIHVATVLGNFLLPDGHWNFMLDPDKKIALIRISTFSRNTTNELKDALEIVRKQDLKGLILDLRYNPGGLLSAAVEISDLFIESGKIVSTKGRNTEERTWEAHKAGTYSGFPMAILVNRFSASASEIVSACLQDHQRAVVVGERTWGKGSVQNVIELEEGKSALKLTTASYHRPSGKNIHRFPDSKETDEWGVMPNEGYKIDFDIAQMQGYRAFRDTRDRFSKDGPPASDFVDTQLQKALEYINTELAKPVQPTPAVPEPPTEEKPTEEKPGEEKKDAAEVGRKSPVIG